MSSKLMAEEIGNGVTLEKIEAMMEEFGGGDKKKEYRVVVVEDKGELFGYCRGLGFSEVESREIVEDVYNKVERVEIEE